MTCSRCGHDKDAHSSPTTAVCQGEGCKCATYEPETYVDPSVQRWRQQQKKQAEQDKFWSKVYSIAVHEKCGADLKEVGHGRHTQWELENVQRFVFEDFVIWKCTGCGEMFDSDSTAQKWTYRFEHKEDR